MAITLPSQADRQPTGPPADGGPDRQNVDQSSSPACASAGWACGLRAADAAGTARATTGLAWTARLRLRAEPPASPASTLKRRTSCAARPACSCMLAAAAAASSTNAAFCCVTVSICATAWLTQPMPEDCSADALEISRTSVATPAHAVHHFAHGAARLVDGGCLRRAGPIRRSGPDFLGRDRRALRQRAHFARHHGNHGNPVRRRGRLPPPR